MAASERAPATQIFDSLAGEIERAGQMCVQMESLMLKLVRICREQSHDLTASELQTVDTLAQHLEGLATFTRQLSTQAHIGGFDVPEAATDVRLGDLAHRLTGEAPSPSAEQVLPSDLELF